MSNTQVAIADTNAVCVGNKEVESESTEETTLTEVHKDLGHTKIVEKTAAFESNEQTSLVEENRQRQTESSKSVVQSESVQVSANRQDPRTTEAPSNNNDTSKRESFSTTTITSAAYKPLEPIKSFEPIKPFEPLKPFEPVKPFEPPKSSESTQQLELVTICGQAVDNGAELPTDHKPVETLSLLKQYTTEPLRNLSQSAVTKAFNNQLPTITLNDFATYQSPLDAKDTLSHLKLFEAEPQTSFKPNSPAHQELPKEVGGGGLPEGYIPVEPLSPLKPFDIQSPLDYQQINPPSINGNQSSKAEIKEESIKNTLKEIISDLDTYAENKELNETISEQTKVTNVPNSFGYEKTLAVRSQVLKEIKKHGGTEEFQDENAPPPKPINLEKIFTPADGDQIQPTKIRKMFASSAFYEKGFHPTVEDQVELAKRISSSLSDISNKSSKGQSMYVNRKKRSVKWVHEGEGRAGLNGSELNADGSEKVRDPLKLVMNPHGQIQDINSLRKQGYNIEPALSPDVCLEIVKDLNSPKGKGAELFAKRRKRSEKWVVGETNGTRPEPIPDIAPSPTPLLSPLPPISSFPPPSYLPETAQRIQHKEKLDEIQEKFNRPRVKLIKSPWDAALETGSVDAAFEVEPVWPTKGNIVAPAVNSYEAALKTDSLPTWTGPKPTEPKMYAHNPAYNSSSINKIVDNLQNGATNMDVYKPTLPQAWNSNQAPKPQQYSSNTLPRSKPKPPLSPSYKPDITPPIYKPKESTSPLPNLYAPSYNAQQSYSPQPSYQPTLQIQSDYISPQLSPSPRKINYDNLQNYNTAPRGWGSTKNAYKPITFDKPKSPYSDF